MSTGLRWLFLALVRLFYPSIRVENADRVPVAGPMLIVGNHPNGLLDPVVLRLALGRPVSFLAKSTLFGNAIGRLAMSAFEAIPVFRSKEADTSKNEDTFFRCVTHLSAAGVLALFPEGTSHSETRLLPLKTGAARIALQFGASSMPLTIVPMGLLYEDKETFRSAVSVTVGRPFTIEAFVAQHALDPKAAVAALTQRIADGLGECVLEADNGIVLKAILSVALWTSPDGGRDEAQLDLRARRLAEAFRRLQGDSPAAAEAVLRSVTDFQRLLQSVGIKTPLIWDGQAKPSAADVWRGLLTLVLLVPIALLGAMLAWVPYRVVKPVAVRLAGRETDVISTIKLLLGLLVLTLTYAFWIGLAFGLFGLGAALGMAVLGPATGFIALRWGERLDRRRLLLRSRWVRANRQDLIAAIAERRAELVRTVEQAVADEVDEA
ncbi:MAG: hypothetical protein EXR76_04570 [Myxococcales bacterium]|nr:hypothetical protein [Myxococcales bacterium]